MNLHYIYNNYLSTIVTGMNNFGCRIAPAAFAVAAACRRIASVAGTAVEVAECIEELVDMAAAVAFLMASAAARTAVVAVLEWLA